MIWIIALLSAIWHVTSACQFYPVGDYLRFVRVPENLKIGEEILQLQVYPRNRLFLQPIDKIEDAQYFAYRDINKTAISLILAKSLENLVDQDQPKNVLKFKISCDYKNGAELSTSSLSVTVYVEDINDHHPVFVGTPYKITVDELTPPGLTIFRAIRATDRDKPNTPNSDVQYSIVSGNDGGKFSLDNSHQAFLLLRKPLDFDAGDREFVLTVNAADRGFPPKSTNTTIKIVVVDNDDLTPKFTKGVYRTKLPEFYPISGERIHRRLNFEPPIFAFDQDLAIDTPIRYDIIAGNERHLFSIDHVNGSIFLEREIDLDAERALPGNTFVLQIQAAQVDNPLKSGVARVEVEIVDINDNLPEFEVDFYNISIVENLPNGFSVLQIVATDQDQGDNGDFTYQLDDKSAAFALDSRSGWLTVKDQAVLDREKRNSILLKVYAKEKVPNVVSTHLQSYVNVEVTLLDANDNNPTFLPKNLYSFSTDTAAKKGEIIGKIKAEDPDLGRNGMVRYSVQRASNISVPFDIDEKSGDLMVYETPLTSGRHLLFVEAYDNPLNPSERRSSLAVVSVDVSGIESKTSSGLPDFVGAPYEFWVGGNVDIGTSVGQIRVSNVPDYEILMYDLLHTYHDGVPFAVEERSGTITVVDALNKFKRDLFEFESVVTNEKDIYLSTNVTIHIVDPEDQKSILMKTNSVPIEFHVKENQPNILIGKLGFKKTSTTALKFSIANQKDVTDFIAITSDGTLHTVKGLDREFKDSYYLTIIAEFTKGTVSGTGIYQVTVFVDDENDNAPSFDRDNYIGKVPENSPVGTEIELNYPIKAQDKDTGENGLFTVILSGIGNDLFRIDKNSGKLFFVSTTINLDREKIPLYNLTIIAKDKGGLFSESKLSIRVLDVNDNPPIISKFSVDPIVRSIEYDSLGNRIGDFDLRKNKTKSIFTLNPLIYKKNKEKNSPLLTIPEDAQIGRSIIEIFAKDLDENSQIGYEILSEIFNSPYKNSEPFHLIQYFTINSSGKISISRSLPPLAEFRLNISASDEDGLNDHICFKIRINDVNNHPPVFKKSWYNFDVEEGAYYKKTLGLIEASDSDYGSNSNVTYEILDGDPFSIGTSSGILSINGILDRETKDKYIFEVTAMDNPDYGPRLTSKVKVEVNVLDVNDNPPSFYAYDDYRDRFPVYYANVPENAPLGSIVAQIYANDSDFGGNGNGLVLYDIPYKKNQHFAIDSKRGIVTNIGRLNYDVDKIHNVTIVASDLGSPSLSSTAILMVNVIDFPEDVKSFDRPIFAHRYYEIEVEENAPVPLKLVQLNLTEYYRKQKWYFEISDTKDRDIKEMYRIDRKNGTLYIVKSPDREKRSLYELIIKVDKFKLGREMTSMVYPIANEKLGTLSVNEVKVIVKVKDVNDNYPKFSISGRPIVAAIPTTASYGHHVIKLEANDADLGLNSEVRYQILSRNNESSRRFSIDPVSGQLRVTSTFAKDAGKVFGFDVKATDRKGADDGKSAIANVLVYVLEDQQQLVMVMGIKPIDAELKSDNITSALYNITGFDVRIRELEPHLSKNQGEIKATEINLYAVDPLLNSIVDMNNLQDALQRKRRKIEDALGIKVLDISTSLTEKEAHYRNQRILLSSLEIAVIILGSIILIGISSIAICVACIKKNRKQLSQKKLPRPIGYTLASGIGKPTFYPTFGDICFETDGQNKHPRASKRIGDPGFKKSRGSALKSITSIHSSGQDSGIADNPIQCQCHSGKETSEESSYEDSLQSTPPRRTRDSSVSRSNPSLGQNPVLDRRSRNRSITETIVHPSGLHRIQSLGNLTAAQPILVPVTSALHKSTDRLMFCPINH